VLLAWLRRQSIRYEVKAAALAAAMLATPYLYIYDFPELLIPIAFLLRMGLRDGFPAFELPGIAASYGLIPASPMVAMPTGFAAATLVAALIVWRAAAECRGADRAAMRKSMPA
jgi:arabinofuranan 3-O-arabinosyltransferase